MGNSEYGTGVLLSIHLTSNRPENIVPFFDNLEATASDHENFEICLKIDDDDEAMNRVMEREAAIRPFRIRYISTPLPEGFWGLWRALNDLVGICDPDAYFLVNFNDEMCFLEPGWDEALARYKGFYPDHIFRLRTSRFRFRNYRDYWECGYAPETSAFTTKRWIDIQGDWNACIGPDTFQQTVSHYLSRSNWPGQFQYNRDVPVNDIKIGGEGAGLGMSEEQWRRWSRAAIRNWFHIMSTDIQTEANRRARLLQAHLFASNQGLNDYGVVEDSKRAVVQVFNNAIEDDRPIATFPYKLSRLRIGLTNWWRGFHYYYYGGGGPDVARQWWSQQRIYLSLRYAWVFQPFEKFARGWHAARYTPDRSGEGTPIASGNDPTAVFNSDTQVWWVSPERGEAVRRNSYVGCVFDEPKHIRMILLTQTSNKPFRQDRVRIERSTDGGETWSRVRSRPFFLRGTRSTIGLAASGPATHWRVVANGRNARSDLHAWTPIQVEMFEARPFGQTWALLLGKPVPADTADAMVEVAETAQPDAPTDMSDVGNALRDRSVLLGLLDAGDAPAAARAAAVMRRHNAGDPLVYLAEGHAKVLASDVADAIPHYRAGLEAAPGDRELQLALLQACAQTPGHEADCAALSESLRVEERDVVFEGPEADPAGIAASLREYGCAVLRSAVDRDLARRLFARSERHVYRLNGQPWHRPGERWNMVYPLSILDENLEDLEAQSGTVGVPPVGPADLALAAAFTASLDAGLSAIGVDCSDASAFRSAGVAFRSHGGAGYAPAVEYGGFGGACSVTGFGVHIALAESGLARPGFCPVPVPLSAAFPMSRESETREAILGVSPRIVLGAGDAFVCGRRSLFASWMPSESEVPRVGVVLHVQAGSG